MTIVAPMKKEGSSIVADKKKTVLSEWIWLRKNLISKDRWRKREMYRCTNPGTGCLSVTGCEAYNESPSMQYRRQASRCGTGRSILKGVIRGTVS